MTRHDLGAMAVRAAAALGSALALIVLAAVPAGAVPAGLGTSLPQDSTRWRACSKTLDGISTKSASVSAR